MISKAFRIKIKYIVSKPQLVLVPLACPSHTARPGNYLNLKPYPAEMNNQEIVIIILIILEIKVFKALQSSTDILEGYKQEIYKQIT